MKRRSSRLASIGLALVSTAIGFGILERYVARVLEQDPVMKPVPREDLFKPSEGCGLPGWKGELLGCDAPLHADEKQILILGDSFAAGAGGVVEDSFSYDLRYPGFRVRNCAVGGYNLERILAAFDRQSARFRPAITIYALVLNDFSDVPMRALERRPIIASSHPDASGVVDDYILFRTRNFQAWLDENAARFDPLTRLLLRTHTGAWLYRRWQLREIGAAVEEGYRSSFEPRPALEAAFDRIAAMGQRTDHLLVMIFPLFERLRAYPFEDAHRTIRESLAKRGVPFLDLLDVFRGRDERDLIVCATDHHPNARGHQMTLQALRQKLEQLGWVSAR
jgi:hypothetical protein